MEYLRGHRSDTITEKYKLQSKSIKTLFYWISVSRNITCP